MIEDPVSPTNGSLRHVDEVSTAIEQEIANIAAPFAAASEFAAAVSVTTSADARAEVATGDVSPGLQPTTNRIQPLAEGGSQGSCAASLSAASTATTTRTTFPHSPSLSSECDSDSDITDDTDDYGEWKRRGIMNPKSASGTTNPPKRGLDRTPKKDDQVNPPIQLPKGNISSTTAKSNAAPKSNVKKTAK